MQFIMTLCMLEVSMAQDRRPPTKDIQDSGNKNTSAQSKSYRRRYSDYFEFAPVGYFIFDWSGVILNVNPAGALLLGANRNQLMSQPFAAFIAPDFKDVYESHIRELFKRHKKQSCDLKLLNGNGLSHWVQLESVAIQNDIGDVEQIRTVINVITKRKLAEDELRTARDELEQKVFERTAELEKINAQLRTQVFECENAEAALRESENKYSTLVEDALIGVYINKDGKIEFANDKFAAIYGYSKNEMIGMDSTMLVHPEDRLWVQEFREKRLRGEKVPSEY
jgi:PAS domain S-box-containing protein